MDDFARHQQSPSRTGGFEEKRHVEKSSFRLVQRPDPALESSLERLVRERQELMDTGVYGKDDLLIRELDRQISTKSQGN